MIHGYVPKPSKEMDERNDYDSIPDNVNHPSHYKVGGIECLDYIEAKGLNYNMGNAIKYISRAEHKGNKVEDLKKAIFYLEREIKNDAGQ